MKTVLSKIKLWCECTHCPAKFTHEAEWSALKHDWYSTYDGDIGWRYLEITCPTCKESEEVKIIDD